MRFFIHLNLFVLVALLAILAPTPALADTTGILSGHIVDFNTQRPIADVVVEATSPSADRKVHTDSHGDFVLLNLPPDDYRLTFTHNLYFANASSPIAIHSGDHQYIVAALKREFALIDGIISFPIGYLVRAGVTSDVYRMGASTASVTRVGDSMSSVLRFVPGVEVGPGFRMLP